MARIRRDWERPDCNRPWTELNSKQQDAFARMSRELPKQPGSGASSAKHDGCLTLLWHVPNDTAARVLIVSYKYSRAFRFLPTYTFVCLDWSRS
jgi:hypothetical protein